MAYYYKMFRKLKRVNRQVKVNEDRILKSALSLKILAEVSYNFATRLLTRF